MKLLATISLLAICACQELGEPAPPPSEPRPPDPPPEKEALGPDFDFTAATFALANISQSEGTISHDGQLAFLDRYVIAVFSEPKPDDFGDQDIYRSNFAGSAWQPDSVTFAATTQLAFPAIARSGDALWYSWTGREAAGASLDVWAWRVAAGGAQSAQMNVTTGEAEARNSFESRIVADGLGGVEVLYLSSVGTEFPGDYDVRVKQISESGAIGASERIFQPATGSCRELRAEANSTAAVAAVICGGSAPLVLLTREGGVWQSSLVPMGESRSPSSLDLAVEDDGTIHLVWAGSRDCGPEVCRRVFYSRNLGAPVEIGDEAGFMPVVAADPFGRPVVAFHRTGDAPVLLISHSNDGETFAAPRPISPASAYRDTSATDLAFDADGRPHLLFERVYSGSSPLNVEVMHATIP